MFILTFLSFHCVSFPVQRSHFLPVEPSPLIGFFIWLQTNRSAVIILQVEVTSAAHKVSQFFVLERLKLSELDETLVWLCKIRLCVHSVLQSLFCGARCLGRIKACPV